MTIALLFILELVVIGLPVAVLLDRGAGPGRSIGEAFLFGSGIISLLLLLQSQLGVSWSPLSLAISLLSVLIVLWTLMMRSRPRLLSSPTISGEGSLLTLPIHAITVAMVSAHARYAVAGPIPQWDFWAIWGLKAKIFYLQRGVDWRYLEDASHRFTHPDYPLLPSLLYDAFALVRGGWEDRWLGLLTTAFAVAALLVVHDLLRKESRSPFIAAIGTLGFSGIALSPWIGMAEAPLIAFAGTSLLVLRRGFADDDARLIGAGAILLGLAAFTKNEGQTVLAATFIAVALTFPPRLRSALRLWPAVLVSLPWILLRSIHHLPNDLTAGDPLARLASQIGPVMASIVSHRPPRLWYWLGVLAALVLTRKRMRSHDRFVVVTVVMQVLAYIAAYAITPHGVDWQVATSWPRLLQQIAMPIGFVAVMLVSREIAGSRGAESIERDEESKSEADEANGRGS